MTHPNKMQMMYWSIMGKKELSGKARPSSYQLIYDATLTYGHELKGQDLRYNRPY